MRPHSHLNQASVESLEPRLMLAADPFAGGGTLIAGPVSAPGALVLTPPSDGAVFVDGYWNIPDLDWWYGDVPTVTGMQVAYWQDMMVRRLHDVNTSVYPGGYSQWQYGAYPSLNSDIFATPSHSNGIVAGWAYQSSAVWDTTAGVWDGESAQGHLPDSIADFLGTFSNPQATPAIQSGTNANNIAWGLRNFMAWDDPRTAANDSWNATISTQAADWTDYKNQIIAGRPVQLLLANEKGQTQSVLGVGYYQHQDPTDLTKPPIQCIEIYDGWHNGVQQWEWTDEDNTGLKYSVAGEVKMSVNDQVQGLTGYAAISAPDASQLTVEIGLGNPAAPTWRTFWAGAPSGQNLVLTDLDLSGAWNFLSSSNAENWYMKVTNASGATTTIMDFQVRYNGSRWFTPNAQQVLVGNTGTVYLQSHIKGIISGTVFSDSNGDGIGAGDLPLAGWHVYLDQCSNPLMNGLWTTTDAQGHYQFSNLPVGTYTVELTMQAGWYKSSPTVGTWTGQPSGQSVTQADFGVTQYAQISGSVYNDLDASGTLTGGDLQLKDWTVYLDSNNNAALDVGERQATTDITGAYSFNTLTPGTYHVLLVSQHTYAATSTADMTVTVTGGGSSNLNDFFLTAVPMSDLTGTGSDQSSFSPSLLSPGQTLDATFGIVNNGNVAANSVLVRLYASTDATITTEDILLGEVTLASVDANSVANAVFSGALPTIIPGNYYVGIVIDPDNTVDESSEANNAAVDDTYPLLVPGISGQLWYDINADGVRDANEAPLAGWTVFLDANLNNRMDANEARTVTDDQGRYGFANVAPATYHVVEVKPTGWTQASPITTFYTIQYQALDYDPNTNFSNYKSSIADLKDDGDAYSRFLPTEVTAPGGSWDVWWDIRNAGTVASGPFRVEFYVSLDDSMATTADNYILGYADVKDAIAPGSFKDVNLSLLTFPAIPAGNYHVGIVIDSLDQVLESDESNNTGIDLDRYPLVIDCAPDLVSQGDSGSDFSPTKVNPGDRFDASWTIANTGMAASGGFYVDFYASSSPTVTTFDYRLGRVWVAGIPANSTVKVEMPDMAFPEIPAGQYYIGAIIDSTSNVTEMSEDNNTSVNERYLLQVSGITGTEFNDADGDGVFDYGESSLPGWKVYIDQNNNGLYDAGEKLAITGDDGTFSFTNVAPGTNTIRAMGQSGWVQTGRTPHAQTVSYTSGSLVTGVTFGAAIPSKAAGFVYLDFDGNLVFNRVLAPGNYDHALAGWDVKMWRDDNANNRLDADELDTLRQFATNPAGDFTFAGLAPGHYVIEQTLVGDYIHVGPTTGLRTLDITSANLFGNQNFANAEPSEIDGRVWHDHNANGLVDSGEEGLPGWRIYIDANNNGVWDKTEQYTWTGVNGSFSLQGLRPGQEIVRDVVPSGWGQSTSGGFTWPLVSDSMGLNTMFGGYQTGTISGMVWHDKDADAVHKPGESLDPTDLRTVYIDVNNNGQLDGTEQHTTTAADGSYTLTGLSPGTYTVREAIRDGWSESSPATSVYSLVITSGANITGADFGDYVPGAIGGTVWLDTNGDGKADGEHGLPGWRVYLDQNLNGVFDEGETSTLTNSQGGYVFSGLIPSRYVVREVLPANYIQTAPEDEENTGQYTVDILSGGGFPGCDFGNTQYGEIHGTVWNDANGDGIQDVGEAPVAGRTVYLDLNANGTLDENEPSTLTLANGTYALLHVMPGTYTVAEVLPTLWIPTAPKSDIHVVTMTAGQVLQDMNFAAYQAGEIDGTVWQDLNLNGVFDNGEPGLAGWIVYIDKNNDGTYNPNIDKQHVLTDAQGKYVFGALQPGVYTVRQVVPTGWKRITPLNDFYTTIMVSGTLATGKDFGDDAKPVAANATFTTDEDVLLSGQLSATDAENQPLVYNRVDAPAHGTLTVNADGTFQYAPQANWSGQVTFTYAATDSAAYSNTATITINVTAVNDAPVTTVPPLSTNEDTPLTFTMNASDVESSFDQLVFTVPATTAHGTLTMVSHGQYRYTPNANYNGPDSFTYTVTDGNGLSSTATVDATVAPVNDRPVAVATVKDTRQEEAVQVVLSGSDIETLAADLTYIVAAQPRSGSVVINGNVATFTPAPGFYGQMKFTYSVVDTGDQGSNTPATSTPVEVTVNVARRVTIDATHKGNLVLAGGAVTATVKGPGTGVLYLKYAETSNRPDILAMAFTGTTANTVITFTGAMVRTGDVTIDGSIKSFTASTMVLSGDFTANGYVGILSMNDVSAGHQITLGQSAKLTTALSFDQVTDLKLVSAASLSSLKATEWLHAGGTSSVTAPTLAKLTIPGNKKLAIVGSFQGDLNLTGALGSAAIAGNMSGDWNVGSISGAVTVAGTIRDTTLRSVGNIKSLTMGAVIGSNFLAGIAPGVDGHPTVIGEFIADASIGTIKVTGLPTSKIDPSTRLVQNSNFAAATIGKATLVNLETENGSTPFGFFARNLPKHGVAGVSISDLLTRVKAMHPGVFTADDFVISLL